MNQATARVVRFHQTGDASVLNIERLPIQQPRDHQIRIKVEAIGLNRAEIMFRNDAYLETPELPSRLGYEAAGIVDAVGAQVTEFQVGDRVSTIPAFSMGEFGVYGEQVVVPTHAVAPLPAHFNAQQGAAIWMQYITAYGALVDIGQLKAGQTIVVTAASSSVGVAAIQLAKALGAKVIATTRGTEKIDFLKEQGADLVIATDVTDLIEAVGRYTSRVGADLVFDPIGGPILNQLAEASKNGGRIIEYGALDQEPTPYPLFTALAKGLIIQGYTLFEITQNHEKLAAAKRYLLPLFEAQKLTPIIDRVFDFDNIQEAHRYMESNQQTGKIVVDVP